jgi:hypothetical protein
MVRANSSQAKTVFHMFFFSDDAEMSSRVPSAGSSTLSLSSSFGFMILLWNHYRVPSPRLRFLPSTSFVVLWWRWVLALLAGFVDGWGGCLGNQVTCIDFIVNIAMIYQFVGQLAALDNHLRIYVC